ncbi:MAG: mechanosensitive ion channel family protein [Flavobacteriales bacterium]
MLEAVRSYFQDTPGSIQLLILAFSSTGVGILITRLALSVILKPLDRGTHYVRDSFRIHLGGWVWTFLPLLFFYFSLPLLELSSELRSLLAPSLRVLLILDLGWLLLKGLNVMEDVFFNAYKVRRDKYLKERKIRTQIQFLKKALGVLIFLFVTGGVLLNFEAVQKIGSTLLTSTAVIGIVVGLAARKTIGDLIHGFQIAFTQPIKIDDTVIVEGEWGVVEEITLTYVVVKIWDKRRLILPISYFIEQPFQNWTRNSEDILGEIELFLDPRMPLDPLRERFQKDAKAHSYWDGRACRVQVVENTERSMRVKGVVSAEDSDKAWDLKCDLRESLLSFLREEYPQYLPHINADLDRSNAFGPQ